MTMDVRLYILAGTFALMVVSLITVVFVAARVRRRDKTVALDEHPSMPPLSMDDMAPVDADLAGLEVPVPENSPHAALLKPLAEKPVWEETLPSRRRARRHVSAKDSPTPVADSLLAEEAPLDLKPETPAAPQPPAAAPVPAEFPEGPGRIPRIGSTEVHRLPSADEILASLEAEMARQGQEGQEEQSAASLAATTEQEPAVGEPAAPEDVAVSRDEATRAPAAPGDVRGLVVAPPRTASGAGVPAEQVQWRPESPATSEQQAVPSPPAPAVEVEADPEAGPVAPEPAPDAEPVREHAVAIAAEPVTRPAAVVRAVEPPAAVQDPEPAAATAGLRPAVRVAGIRVPLQTEEPPEAAQGLAESGDVPEIELSSPVEMWFGEHRIGVKQGTATFDRLQRYAETLLSDLRESRDEA